ncbi:MAG TPA: hypothetical protein VFM67_02210 [Gaiella sp.]|jgi:hypothetical protein|nr:hypothetical protein [Gaiella sp.]
MGARLGGFVYGTIVVLSVLVAGARAYPHSAGRIAGLVLASSVVFWVAHVYAHGISESITDDERLSVADLRRIARHEASIVEASLPPLVALLLGALGVVSTQSAVWLAFALGLLVLFVEGIVVARVERLAALGTVAVVAANLALGLALVALKLVLGH